MKQHVVAPHQMNELFLMAIPKTISTMIRDPEVLPSGIILHLVRSNKLFQSNILLRLLQNCMHPMC